MRSQPLLSPFEVHRKLPVNYNTMAPGKEAFIHAAEYFPAVSLQEINNAYVSPYGVVFKNGRVLHDSVYGMFDPKTQWPTFIKKILTGKTRSFENSLLVAHHAFYENYFHWLCEIMPRIFISLKALKDEKISLLINERIPSFVRQFLDLFNLDIVTIRDNELAKTPHVYYPTQIARPLAYHEGSMRDLSGWLYEQLNDPGITGSPEKIFISRKNARYRITHHEDQVREYLLGQGFSIICPEEHSIKEQMNLFKHARIIMGSHGAGFSNLLFAPHCKLIVDIIHREHPQDCFYNLANVFDTAYYFFQCEGKGILGYKNNDDVVVDIDEFILRIGPLIK